MFQKNGFLIGKSFCKLLMILQISAIITTIEITTRARITPIIVIVSSTLSLKDYVLLVTLLLVEKRAEVRKMEKFPKFCE